ncbi:hypothetical protein L6164_001376 [Bauhinia variegata]|uniref:Uncharacterized protein n=1 Tax=Bauhinia variegata TaxID=167791 RepID=A0ACB9Q9E4_BAUVA|nr:hypothetical protein L6164_001376 [Bauhinia variegata]
MTDEGKAECERLFKRFDQNGDGKISLSEMAEAFKAFGATASTEEVQRRMTEMDKDGDGFLSFEEVWEFNKANPSLMKEVMKKL